MTTTMQDQQPILDLIARANTAWAEGDADAYGELFTEDAEYITWFGRRSYGRQEIADSHRPLFAMLPKGAAPESVGEPPRIRFLRPDVAVVSVVAESPVRRPGEKGATSIVTYVAVEQPDGWRFASFQNTRETEIPGRPGGGQGPRP